jgi:hypothetical protein
VATHAGHVGSAARSTGWWPRHACPGLRVGHTPATTQRELSDIASGSGVRPIPRDTKRVAASERDVTQLVTTPAGRAPKWPPEAVGANASRWRRVGLASMTRRCSALVRTRTGPLWSSVRGCCARRRATVAVMPVVRAPLERDALSHQDALPDERSGSLIASLPRPDLSGAHALACSDDWHKMGSLQPPRVQPAQPVGGPMTTEPTFRTLRGTGFWNSREECPRIQEWSGFGRFATAPHCSTEPLMYRQKRDVSQLPMGYCYVAVISGFS